MLALMLIAMLMLAFNIQPVKTEPATIIVPEDYPTIQEAINNADEGDTIYVRAGTYYENIVVNKTVSLIGENKNVTVIKSAGSLSIFEVTANFVAIKNFTILNGFFGIYIANSGGNIICNNNIISCNGRGLYLEFSENNTVEENTVYNNGVGILLAWSSKNNLRHNDFYDNKRNFAVSGTELSHFIQKVDISNMVDGKPIYYWVNENNKQVPTNAGLVVVVNSTGIKVKDLVLMKNGAGVLFTYTNNSIIENVTSFKNFDGISLLYSHDNRIQHNILSECDDGIYLRQSTNNTINANSLIHNSYGIYSGWYSFQNIFNGNMISYNKYGIFLAYSYGNIFYHNNFIRNGEQVSSGSFNFSGKWDNGYPSGGNYWSDYSTRYPSVADKYKGENQDIPGSDGIWDHPYEIDADNLDNYPLVEPWSPLPRTIVELKTKIEELGFEGKIDNQGIVKSLIAKLNVAQKLVDKEKIDEANTILADDFIPQVQNQSGIHITKEAAYILIQSAEYILSHL